jgi:hypothetical protein
MQNTISSASPSSLYISYWNNPVTNLIHGISAFFSGPKEISHIPHSPLEIEKIVIRTLSGELIHVSLSDIDQCLQRLIHHAPTLISKFIDQKAYTIKRAAKQASLTAMKSELDLIAAAYYKQKNKEEILNARKDLGNKLREALLPKLGIADEPATVIKAQTIPMKYCQHPWRIVMLVSIFSAEGERKGVLCFDSSMRIEGRKAELEDLPRIDALYFMSMEEIEKAEPHTLEETFPEVELNIQALHFLSMEEVANATPKMLGEVFPRDMVPFLKTQADLWNKPLTTLVSEIGVCISLTSKALQQIYTSSAEKSSILIEIGYGKQAIVQADFLASYLASHTYQVPIIESKFIEDDYAREYEAKQISLDTMKRKFDLKASAYYKQKKIDETFNFRKRMGNGIRKELLPQLGIADELGTTIEIKIIPQFPGQLSLINMLVSVFSEEKVWQGVVSVKDFDKLEGLSISSFLSMEEIGRASQQRLEGLFPAAMVPFLQKQANACLPQGQEQDQDDDLSIASWHIV